MFNAGNPDAGCSKERYRLTDVHQPTTAVVLSTAAPGWPCGRDSSEKKEEDEKTEIDALSKVDTVAIENISDSTVREVLKVIESVDTSFIRHRSGRVTGNDRPSEMTELMRLFHDRRTDIFVYDPNKPVKRPTGAKGDWDIDEKKRELILQDVDNVVETKTPRKVKVDSPISAEKSRSLKKQKRKVDVTRVSRGLGATQGTNEHAPSVEDEIRKKTESLSNILNGFNLDMEGWDCDLAEGADLEESDLKYALQLVKALNNSILPFLTCGESFENVEKNVMTATMKHLCTLMGLGSKALIYEEDEDSSSSARKVEIALGGGVLLSRLILKAAKSMVISEECLEMCVETSRYQLQQNILPFYDARLRAAIRPILKKMDSNDCDVEMCEGNSNKTKVKIPAILGHVVDRMSVLINLIGDIAPLVHFPVSLSSPLLRVVIQSMTTDYLPEIKNNSVNLVSAIICASPEIRQKTLEDIFTAMTPVLGSGRKCRRDIQVASDNGTLCNVSIMTAIIVKITQGCAEIPSLSTVDHIKQAYGECITVADQFWILCMERLFALKTTRMETDADFSCVMLGIVEDMLDLSAALHWPVVATLLIRLVSILNSDAGLRSTETLVKQLCVDLLGKILVSVYSDSHSLNEIAGHLDEISKSRGYENANEAATEIVLQMLSDLDFPSVQSARKFLILRDLCEQVDLVCKSEEDEEQTSEQVVELLKKARDDLKRHSTFVYENLPNEEDGKMMMKILVHEQFSSAAPAMLSWILEIMETKQQASTIRAKAVKAIGDILSADSNLLKLTSMHDAIEHALQDASISVREAALTLVGKHMVQDPSLASSLLHVVVKATDDPGASVRRSAIRILKDCAVVIPYTESNRVNDAYRAILGRSTDQEESVKSLVGKIFKSLWLQPRFEGENGVKYNRSISERAASMANLVMSVVNTSGSSATTRNVLQNSSPLIVLMKDLLSDGDGETLKASYDKEMHGIALSLLESAVHMSGETVSSTTDGVLPYLHAIYAISVSNASYCIPESDPMKFLRSLAPYLKMGDLDQSAEEAKIAAEQTLCLLGIISNILRSANEYSEASMEIATDISSDLVSIINQHRFTIVISSACMCLAACALVSKFARERLFSIAAVYLCWLEEPKFHLRNLPRFIFIVGQLYRYGANHFERLPVTVNGSPQLSQKMALPAVLKLFGSFWDMKIKGAPALAAQIQRNALETICQVMIASPLVAMAKESRVQAILAEALSSTSSPTLKLTALNGLIELVEADSNALHSLQHQDSRFAQRGKKRKSMASDNICFSSRTAVATENGEGDLSHSSSILQNHWDAILALATDIPPLQNSEEQHLVLLRRRILVLMELAQRDGLVGPWSTVPTLVIFSMDATQDISGKALSLLKSLSKKYMEYVDAGRLAKGVKDSHFQFEKSRNADTKFAQAQLRKLYLGIICQTRVRRNEFLRLITRSFKSELVSSSQSKTTPSRTPGEDGMPQKTYSSNIWVWLAHLICGLPFRKTEEVCLVINEIDSMLAFRMSSIVAELHELIESDVPEEHPTVKECGARAKILCLLSRMKAYLLKAYSISAERQAVFASSLKRRGPEDSTPVSLDAKVAKQLTLADEMLSEISMQDKTSISILRELYNELDMASTDQEEAFDPGH